MDNKNIIIIEQPSYCSRELYLKLCLEKLLANFSDMSNDDISDILEYYSEEYRRKAITD